MKVMDLKPLVALRIAGDPALYAEAPFLAPMKEAAMRVAKKFGVNCSQCQKIAQTRAGHQVASAMAALIMAEHGKGMSQLNSFKEVVRKILNTQFDRVLIRYAKDGRKQVFEF
jgi:hypothetical protein